MKALLFLALVSLVLVLFWYKPGHLIGGGEEGLVFLNPKRTLALHKDLWGELQTGQPLAIEQARLPTYEFLVFLSNLGISSGAAQIFLFFLLLLVSTLAVFYLLKEFGVNSQKYRILASLFYILNPFMYASIWLRFLLPMAFFMPLLPLTILLFYRLLKSPNLRSLLLFLLPSFIFSFAFSTPSNAITLWIVVSLFGFSVVIQKRKNKILIARVLIFSLVAFISWIFTNLWWVVPIMLRSGSDYINAFSSDYNLSVLQSLSSQFPLLSNLTLGYKDLFSSTQRVIAIVLSLIAFGGIFAKENKLRIFSVTLLVITIIFINGVNSPFGKIFEKVFTLFSPFQLFRNPYEKFGIVLVFLYTISIPFGLMLVIRKSGVIITQLFLLVVAGFLVQLWFRPIFKNAYIQVPPDYSEINRLINEDNDYFRILHLPINPGDGVYYSWNTPYSGIDPSRHLFDKPSMAMVIRRAETDAMWAKVRETFYTGELKNIIKHLNVKYIILHKDVSLEDEKFLSAGISPGGKREQMCNDQSLKYDAQSNHYTALCEVFDKNRDWESYNFLETSINASRQGAFKVDIQDNANRHLVFNGQIDKRFDVSENDISKEKTFLFNFYIPTERYNGFDPHNVRYITFYFFPVERLIIDQGEVNVSATWAMKGVTKASSFTKYIKETENLKVYQVEDQYLGRLIYAVSDDNIPRVAFDKISPSFYEIHITDATNPFQLIFSESFDKEWKIFDDKVVIEPEKINEYANGFNIKRYGTYTLALRYKPQDAVERAKNITKISFGTLFFMALISSGIPRKYYRKKP